MAIGLKAQADDWVQQPVSNATLGADIRALRRSRGMTLSALADTLGRSVGFLSQIERGISEPSIADLKTIAGVFGVSVSFFFDHASDDLDERRHIVRAGKRRALGSQESGLVEQLLSPDLGGSFEIIHCEFAPGCRLDEPQHRQTEEAGYVVSGQFEIEISGKWHELGPGDSFRFCDEPYRWQNTGHDPAILIWVVSPPTY